MGEDEEEEEYEDEVEKPSMAQDLDLAKELFEYGRLEPADGVPEYKAISFDYDEGEELTGASSKKQESPDEGSYDFKF